MKTFITDIAEANRIIDELQVLCRHRRVGFCWEGCAAFDCCDKDGLFILPEVDLSGVLKQ